MNVREDINDDKEENTLENAFKLLHKGKEYQSNGDNWNAATVFFQATRILQGLAQEPEQQKEEQSTKDLEESKRIMQLYLDKSKHYFHESRKCLIEAMKLETEQEKEQQQQQKKETNENDNDSNIETSNEEKDDIYLFSSLTDEEAKTRNDTFQSLFSRSIKVSDDKHEIIEKDQTPNKEQPQNEVDVAHQQLSIEERLTNLNKSLPKGLKTDEERMSDLNKSLNKFGLSLYEQKEPFARLRDEIPKSEDEQISNIIEQAQDEVAFERKFKTNQHSSEFEIPTSAKSSKDDSKKNIIEDDLEEDDTDDDDDDDDSDDDKEELNLLDDDQLAIRKIRKYAVKAQVQLAELIALLDEANSAKEKENEERDLIDDDGNDSDDVLDGGEAYLSLGQRKLKRAQRALNKARKEWAEELA